MRILQTSQPKIDAFQVSPPLFYLAVLILAYELVRKLADGERVGYPALAKLFARPYAYLGLELIPKVMIMIVIFLKRKFPKKYCMQGGGICKKT
jgi:hypothetical protein